MFEDIQCRYACVLLHILKADRTLIIVLKDKKKGLTHRGL